MSVNTCILHHEEILQKVKRLAWQVYENNYQEKEIVIIGIKERGKVVADLLHDDLLEISDFHISKAYIELNQFQPLDSVIESESELNLTSKCVILVDDVLNTGKTLMLAAVPILLQNPSALQTVILANRDHKKFAIAADYVGISLATTLQEHISFTHDNEGAFSVTLS